MGINTISSSQDTLDLLQQAAEQRAIAQQQQEQKAQQQQVAAAAGESAVEEQAVQTNAETLSAAAGSIIDTDGGSDSNQTLIDKANSGAELTASELNELKQLDLALYNQVVKAQESRAELKAQMQASPNEATRAAQAAIQRVADSDEDPATKVLARNALEDVYNEFSVKYDQSEF